MQKKPIQSLMTAAILVAVLGSGCQSLSPIRDTQTLPSSEFATPEKASAENQNIPETPTGTASVADGQQRVPVNADSFLDVVRFRSSANVPTTSLRGKPIAGVVNHHALASDMLTRFFRELRAARPDVTRFIILSPDHFKRGTSPISVGTFDYTTEGETVRVDRKAVESLLKDGATAGSRPMMEGEHGIGALMPFLVREYGSGVTFIPIAIRSDVSRRLVADFGKTLASHVDDHTFIIVSSDMSHYLTESQALTNDIATEKWLLSRDMTAMSRANDDYTDNGPAFVALFSFFNAKTLKPTFERIDHSISTKYGGDPTNTTSYITGVWGIQ